MSTENKVFITPEGEHDYNKRYEKYSIVSYTQNEVIKAYIAIKDVPPFVSILDTNYWKFLKSDVGGADVSGKADKVNTPQIIQCRFLTQLTKEQWDSLKAGDYIIETVGYRGHIVTRIGSMLSNNKRLRLISILTLPIDIGTIVKKDIFISEYEEGENSYILSSTYHICDIEIASFIPQNGMLPNTLYTLGEITTDTTFVMAAATDNTIANVWMWTFNTGSTAPTITWPAQITIWSDGEAPEIETNKYYEVSVMNGVGTIISADIPQTEVEP